MVGETSVAENVFINRQPVNALENVLWKQLYAGTATHLRQPDHRGEYGRLHGRERSLRNQRILMKQLWIYGGLGACVSVPCPRRSNHEQV